MNILRVVYVIRAVRVYLEANLLAIITCVFHIKTGTYGQYKLDDQTVIGITDLTAGSDENWIVF